MTKIYSIAEYREKALKKKIDEKRVFDFDDIIRENLEMIERLKKETEKKNVKVKKKYKIKSKKEDIDG